MDLTFEQKREKAAKKLGVSTDDIPRHIAIIMDGNGRWATQRGLPRFQGHSEGGKIVEKIALHCVDIGVEYLTLYSFSMQNWKRPKEEIDFLMYLYTEYIKGIRPILLENNVKLHHIGQRKKLPQTVLDAIDTTTDITKNNTGMTLGLALNYGARTEIADAVKAIAEECLQGKLSIDNIDHDCISSHLYTDGFKDPDLVIRTSGEMRISNFLLWQISYSEFYVTDTLWPDFKTEDIDKAVRSFANRSRRFGDVNSQKVN
ncbi:MAG: isoprenyl transferase [Sedimentisphaerales bacterium]|nr:isoprenyl transferase [Sedimentisphaerales bacterium]